MMKIKHYLLFALLGFTALTACKKDEKEPLPVVKMGIEDALINGKVNEKIAFSAVNVNDKAYNEEWKLDGEVKSNASAFEFTPLKSGIYLIDYTATNSTGVFTYQYKVNVGVPTVPVDPESNMYVTTLFEFVPAPGQNNNKSLGSMDAARTLEGKTGLVSLGAWGGYIVLGFDHTVINEPGKEDFIVYGNPSANFAEPGIVWVMQDENGNGLPDDTWYELKGSEYGKAGYERDYAVTYTKPAVGGNISWTDNKGNSGTVNLINPTFQYFPSWITGTEYTLKGSVLPKTGLSSSGLITSMPFAFGYADNLVGGDKMDIANAIDKDGKSLSLTGIDFVKIQTGIQANLGILGELSTEVAGVADLSMLK
jgi:hypothetical protein